MVEIDKIPKGQVGFYLNDGVLMRNSVHILDDNDKEVANDSWEERVQVVVPKIFREEILSLAHDLQFGGYLGKHKTYMRTVTNFIGQDCDIR